MTDHRAQESGSSDDLKVSRTPQKVTRTTSPLTPIALLISLVAVGLAVWALVSMPEPASVSATGSPLSGNAKDRVCTAAHTVAMGVQRQTNANIGPEPAAVEAVAANARLAMLGGGEYLLGQISPDTPQELADAARDFATTLQLIGTNALAGATQDDELQAGRMKEAEARRGDLSRICSR
ncbi:hypothetical protein KUF57_03565 [Mycolicibacterium sp. PAM1]|uniref:hypothetical protein n=1 Tax=Mycolicibacterium sp. PAM1 TaxID=2853535 RepID=UPI001C3DE1F1|nr:hypothetical protein [Mycolicibacterium sp. PAM1]MBV5242613.1 hypothetical protein [Mycolicibacterium sp. PAM1]